MTDHRSEGPGETGPPTPRDLPDQQAGAGEDPWEVAPSRAAGDTGEDAEASGADESGADESGVDESGEPATDVPDTDEAGTGRQGAARPATVNPEHPTPDESPA
ncbi:hypothetical protein GCM10027074_63480 [Streptomyces deserti]